MYYITGLLNHLKHIQECLARIEGEAFLNAKDMVMQVRAHDRVLHFQPQFTYTRNGQIWYTPFFEQHVQGFIGWRPYLNRKWPLAGDKLAFKQFAAAHGLRIPAHWLQPAPDLQNFIVKQLRSSFGVGIRGPFRQHAPADPAQQLQPGEFYEALVPGRIAKAWYWAGELICLELRSPSALRGDGLATVAELAARACRREVDQRALGWVAQYQGHAPDSILAEGAAMMFDFKYGSPYDKAVYENENVLPRHQGKRLAAQLEQAGEVLAQAVPDDIRSTTLFTLDAIVDDQDQVWLLEMNSNPMVHPDVYPTMMTRLFAPALEKMEAQAS